MRRFVSYAPSIVVLLATVATLVLAPMVVSRVGYASTTAQIRLAQQNLGANDILLQIDEAQKSISRTVGPSVAHIDARSGGYWSAGGSSGSGWVYDKAGHIVTNAHVVRGSEAIRIQLQSGRVVDAEVVGADAYTDIAVLKIPVGSGVHVARRATGGGVERGQQVFAFGSPFGFKFSMSQGIVSGVGRDPNGAALSNGFTNFIQTDAAVNPGNSGGPLVDVQGRVVGMNVAIATGRNTDGTTVEDGQSAGISFAIPIAVIESVVDQLIEHGEVRRGFLGISFPDARSSPEEVEVFHNSSFWGLGVPVGTVQEGQAAERAGVEPGDVIVGFNDKRVASREVLRSLISSAGPKEQIDLEVFRDGKFVDLDVVLGEFPRENLSIGTVLNELFRLGINFGQLSASDPAYITHVRKNSYADEIGMREGYVVTEVGGNEINSLSDLAVRMDDAGFLTGSAVELTLRSPAFDDRPLSVTIRQR